MKNVMLFGLLLVGTFAFISCEKNSLGVETELQLVDRGTPESEAQIGLKSAPPCNCNLSSKGFSYTVNVCGQGVSSVPCTMSPCPGSGGTKNLTPSDQNFQVSGGTTFQLTNMGGNAFAGSIRCQSGNSTNVSYPISLAPGQVAYFDTNASTCQVGSVACF